MYLEEIIININFLVENVPDLELRLIYSWEKEHNI